MTDEGARALANGNKDLSLSNAGVTGWVLTCVLHELRDKTVTVKHDVTRDIEILRGRKVKKVDGLW